MHVCHLVHHLANGGLEKQVYELVRQSDQVIYTVAYIGDDNSLAEDIRSVGGNVVDLQLGSSGPQVLINPKSIHRLTEFLRNHEFDVLHVHTPLYVHILGRTCATIVGQEHVVGTYHNRRRNFHPVMQIAERLTRSLSTVNVGVSQAVERSFTGRAHEYVLDKGVPRGNSCTIYNGIDVQAFNAAVSSSDSLRSQYGLGDELVFLNVGRYTPQKAQSDLIQAMSKVVEAIPDAHLFIVGWGQLEEKLRRTAHEYGLQEYVTVTGKVPSIEGYYAMADVFVLSSFREGLPIVLLEAMAAELPVVATDISGVPEAVVEDKTGFLVSPESPGDLAVSMAEMESITVRRRLGAEGFNQALEKFDVERTRNAYENLYRDVISKK